MLQIAQFLQTKPGRQLRLGIGVVLFIIAFTLSTDKGIMSSIAIFIGLVGLLFSFSGALGICLLAPLVKSSITGPEPKVVTNKQSEKTISNNS